MDTADAALIDPSASRQFPYESAWRQLRDRFFAVLDEQRAVSEEHTHGSKVVHASRVAAGIDSAMRIYELLDAIAAKDGDYAAAWRELKRQVDEARAEASVRIQPGLERALELQRELQAELRSADDVTRHS